MRGASESPRIIMAESDSNQAHEIAKDGRGQQLPQHHDDGGDQGKGPHGLDGPEIANPQKDEGGASENGAHGHRERKKHDPLSPQTTRKRPENDPNASEAPMRREPARRDEAENSRA